MAITRLGQLHAENRNLSEHATEAVGGSANAAIGTIAKTGGFSYEFLAADRPIGLSIPSTSEFRAGVWLRHRGVTDLSSNTVALFRFSTAPVRYVHYLYPLNVLESNVGTTQQVSAYDCGFMRQLTWMHLGITYKADPTNGFFSFYVDGVQVINFTGALTGGTATIYFGGVPATGNGWTEAWFDDFYFDDTTGEVDSPPPPKRFVFSMPNAAGNDTDWTPTGAASNFQAVDEAPPDNDTSYVEAAATALLDTYNLTAYSLPVHWEDTLAVIAQAWAKELNGDAEIDLHLYDGMYGVGSSKVLTTSYAAYWDRFATRPSGGAWDAGSIDTIQMGYERTL